MKNSLETRLGVFVVLVAMAAVFIVETLGGMASLRGGYRVRALFNTVQDLKVGNSVKMAGVEIGRVEKIALTGNKGEVTMKLHSDAVVKTDSKAVVKFTGLMGQNFVSVDFGSADATRAIDGTVLTTEDQPDLNAVMAKLDSAAAGIQNLTKSFTPDTIDNLLGPLTDFIKQNSGHIAGAISNIESISGQIASGQGTVGKLIYEDSLYASALTTVTNLQDTVAEVRQVVSGVSAGRGTIGKLVTDETLYNATTASMTNLNQVLQKVNQGQGTVGKLVNDQEFYKNAKLSLQKLDKMADGLEDQGPLSVIGIMANNLF
ncbi:MAG: MlaD family protein [Verrucomicrobiota bacterium]|jgi:phospholipid/cholesterol/gamma-HCH transport system substrate-binding protein